MDNAAFGDCDQERNVEVARILADLSSRIESEQIGNEEGDRLALMDINGNRVGEAKVTR